MFHAEIVLDHLLGLVLVSYMLKHLSFGSFILACLTCKTPYWTSEICCPLRSASLCLCYMLESSTSYATEEELELLNHLCQRKESVTTAPV